MKEKVIPSRETQGYNLTLIFFYDIFWKPDNHSGSYL